jgi:hypothetical protein
MELALFVGYLKFIVKQSSSSSSEEALHQESIRTSQKAYETLIVKK